VVGWHGEFGDWKLRVHTRRGWLPARAVSRGTPADLRFVGRRLIALAVEEVGEAIRVVTRRIGSRGGAASPHRVATFRGILDGAGLRLAGRGSTTGVVEVDSYPRNDDRLVAAGRSRRLGLRNDENPRSATASNGASAVLAVRSTRSATVRVRVRAPGAASFGGWSRIRAAHRTAYFANIGLAVHDDGRVVVGTLYEVAGRRTLAVTGVPGGLRRIRTYRRATLMGLGFDRLGRLTTLVRSGGRLEVVRP
jgi:hypothetical protein